MNRYIKKVFIIFALVATSLHGQTIAEKKAGLARNSDLSPEMQQFLGQINNEINEWHKELEKLYAQVYVLYSKNSPNEAYVDLLAKINAVRDNIFALENRWREAAIDNRQQESYALWHQPQTTVGQLVVDYGSPNFVYLMSPEISAIKLSVNSSLPIPRSSWNDMLETVLSENGIGFKQLNPYLRQLIVLKDDKSNVKIITNNRQDLDLFPNDARVSFMITPQPEEVRRIWAFLDRFTNPNSAVLQLVGRDILIIAPVSEVRELLKLYDFIVATQGKKEYKVVPLVKVESEEMAKILSTIFDQFTEELKTTAGTNTGKTPLKTPAPTPSKQNAAEVSGLKVIPLKNITQAVVLIGTAEEIRKGEQIIREVENRVGEPQEKVIFRYPVRHTNPEELAVVLEKIYIQMVTQGVGFGPRGPGNSRDNVAANTTEVRVETPPPLPTLQQVFDGNYYQAGNYVVNPLPIMSAPTPLRPDVSLSRNNFIVDIKSNSIVMVVEAVILDKLKELIRRLDVPAKMVRIEVLLFEKVITNTNQFGLDFLRLGSTASNTRRTGASFNSGTQDVPVDTGIFQFIISRMKSNGFPAFDLTYSFLLTQQDVQVNATPSVVTLNQSPALIAIQDEISINTGVVFVESSSGNDSKQTFQRAQYGITINVFPTIHMTDDVDFPDCDELDDYITLDTEIIFDTIKTGQQTDRPDVGRRKVKNIVSIPDGQTVIIGGLRRRDLQDNNEKIPFFGEIPGIGKLFSNTDIKDVGTDLYVCMTPTIIRDPLEDFERIKYEEARRRPGDLPEFLCVLYDAREAEKNRLLQGTMTMLFGVEPPRCEKNPGPFPRPAW